MVALAPVALSVPWLMTTSPLRWLVPLGLAMASADCALTSTGCERSLCFACAAVGMAQASSSARATASSGSVVVARRKRAVKIMQQLQVLRLQVGAQADAGHSRGSLAHVRRIFRGQPVLLRPCGDIGRVDFRRWRVVEGGAVHVHLAHQLE